MANTGTNRLLVQCLSKKRKCSYLPSKRGGPRKKKKTPIPAEDIVQQKQGDVENPVLTPVTPDFEDGMSIQPPPLLSKPQQTPKLG